MPNKIFTQSRQGWTQGSINAHQAEGSEGLRHSGSGHVQSWECRPRREGRRPQILIWNQAQGWKARTRPRFVPWNDSLLGEKTRNAKNVAWLYDEEWLRFKCLWNFSSSSQINWLINLIRNFQLQTLIHCQNSRTLRRTVSLVVPRSRRSTWLRPLELTRYLIPMDIRPRLQHFLSALVTLFPPITPWSLDLEHTHRKRYCALFESHLTTLIRWLTMEIFNKKCRFDLGNMHSISNILD